MRTRLHQPRQMWSLSRRLGPALRRIGRRLLPARVRRWIRRRHQGLARPAVSDVDFGHLRRVTPISGTFGFDRGRPIDRFYVEQFLARYAEDIRGHVLEFGDDTYTRAFGGDRVSKSDVLHVRDGNPYATIVADLTRADHIPSETFDCLVCTQTLHLIYDIGAAVKTLHRILKPGGAVLATVPGISQIGDDEWGNQWYWSFTVLSARRVFEGQFPSESVIVEACGNVLASTAFLYGLAAEDLRPDELAYRDPHYQTLITIHARKPSVP